MAAKAKSSANVDVSAALRNLGGQFRGLDTRDPSAWPSIPRYTLYAVVAAVVVVALWYLWLNGYEAELEGERAKEVTLRADYQTKVQRAVSLEELKKQRAQVQQYVNVLEKQLPSKAEMDALLSDINQAGLGRSLQFELFRPGQVVVRDYYAELPIALKVSGRYHDIGAFTADIANLSRIVTLNNIAVGRPSNDKDKDKDNKSGAMVLEATAKTFRYLDAEEIAAQRAASKKNQPGAKK
ncbi:type 4a pilus biogenesis protein PilO [Ottowia sp.]|uniref:type 4a pilus biogenesis protein PilO n=1 Tax=Ottowia sp. TaxID=1898956 RepID=UPI0039E296BC